MSDPHEFVPSVGCNLVDWTELASKQGMGTHLVRFALLFSVALTFASMAIAAPRCEFVFQDEAGVLPAIEYKVDSVRAYEGYSLARRDFEAKFGDGSEIENVISMLSAGQKPSDHEKTLLMLKDLRKTAIIIRSEFVLFDRGHEVPETFENFTKALGKMNDVLEFKQWVLVPDAAKTVLKVLKPKKFAKDLRSFDPATVGSIRREIESIADEIATLVKMKDLTVKKFHEIRKSLKHFLTMLAIEQRMSAGRNLPIGRAYDFLFALNEELGAVRDGSLANGLQQIAKGHEVDESKELQPLSLTQKQNIELFLKQFEAVNPAKISREELAQQNHVRFDHQQSKWDVLIPVGKGYKVRSFEGFAEAVAEARRLHDPLDLEAIRQEAVGVLAHLRGEIEKVVGADGDILARVKETDSFKDKLFEKVREKGTKFDWNDLTDIVGTRVVVADARAEKKVAGRLHDQFKKLLVEEHERDYAEGYHAHHLVGEPADSKVQFEIQVMTRRMHQWSSWEHDRLYKPSVDRTEIERKDLRSYGTAIAKTIRILDDGGRADWPRAADFHVREEDALEILP